MRNANIRAFIATTAFPESIPIQTAETDLIVKRHIGALHGTEK